jgi:SOS response regulatory protein OraA/RecX
MRHCFGPAAVPSRRSGFGPLHLRQHDYSRGVRAAIKNDALADEIDAIEREESPRIDARPSRERIRRAVERVYTLPA